MLPDAGAWFAGTYRGGDVGKEAEVSDAVCASRAGHPVWSGLAEDLWRCAKGNASQAAGGEFLTARRREFARFFPKASAPLICGPALFDSPAENEGVRLSREARRVVRAVPWERLPEKWCPVRLGEMPAPKTVARIEPEVLRNAEKLGWHDYYGFLTDEMVTEYEAKATAKEKRELEGYFAVERVVNPRPSENVIATSLFWKNVNTWEPDTVLRFLQIMVTKGIVLRTREARADLYRPSVSKKHSEAVGARPHRPGV